VIGGRQTLLLLPVVAVDLHRADPLLDAPGGEQEVERAGAKLNMTDVAAAIGLGQLAQLDGFNARRRDLARRYFDAFDRSLGCALPPEDFAGSNWHMFQILLPLDRMSIGRGEFMERLHQRGIGSGVHYPAMHLFKLYRTMGYGPGQFPHAEIVGRSILTLPLFPAMADADVERVCEAVRDILRTCQR